MEKRFSTENRIAVVGLGGLFPGAKNITEFWHNIISKKSSVRPLPEDFLKREIYYRPELVKALNKQDKSVTDIAGWIEDLNFKTSSKYKIPPTIAEHMDHNQHAALYTVDEAISANPLQDVSSDRVAVIFGNGMVGSRHCFAEMRTYFQEVEHYLQKEASFVSKLTNEEQKNVINYLREKTLSHTLAITEDSAPGILPNIIAGRVANVYDFHGPSFTIDAACASALASIITGVQGLLLKEYDAVICGGADMSLMPLGFIYFSALNALSPDGSFPFDRRANGFVMGQGAGAVVLKRLEDAIRDNNEIIAVITGYGETSDGKGKYIAAPNAEWQAKTIEKACRMAGYPVDTIEFVEAHGTATTVGDVVEVSGLKKSFASLGATKKNYCGLSSVKSNIGHLKSAAGIAGFIKAALALHHKILPPTANFRDINLKLEIEDSPFYIISEAQEWVSKREYPRRANVSAFGFGGANYHIALEEFNESSYQNRKSFSTGFESSLSPVKVENIKPQTEYNSEVVFFSGNSLTEIEDSVESLSNQLTSSDAGSLASVALTHNYSVDASRFYRIAFLVKSPAELKQKYAEFKNVYYNEQFTANRTEILSMKGIFFQQGKPITKDKIAILFPGQASQYTNMLHSLYERYSIFNTLYAQADSFWLSKYNHTITSLIFPPADTPEAQAKLVRTENAHPAIFLSSYCMYNLLKQIGLQAKYMAGHSLGEITALAASGRIDFQNALRLVGIRGYSFADAELADPGKMVSVKADFEKTQQLIADSKCNVCIANINSAQQTIVGGSSQEVNQFTSFLENSGVKSVVLPVSHAFHSPLVKPVAEEYFEKIKTLPFQQSAVRVLANHNQIYYPDEPDKQQNVPNILKKQLEAPVNFVASIHQLYCDGVRLFVEVGPGAVLGSLVNDILSDKQVSVLSSNYKNADAIESFQKLLGSLFAAGVSLQLIPPTGTVAQIISNEKIPHVTQAKPIITPTASAEKPVIVYSGAALGLPGSYKKSFSDDNFEQLFEGRNQIERLSDTEKQRLVDLQINKLIKSEKGAAFKLLTSLNEVIQLVGKIGQINMVQDYLLDEKDVKNMSSSIAQAVAAGYEAIKDAHIPLVREYLKTSSGGRLPGKLALPKEMQEETGVIFANGFPMVDPIIAEVSRYVSYHYGYKTKKELIDFYQSIIQQITDFDTKKLLSDWFTLNYSRLMDVADESDTYTFNHNFMNQISAQANNRLATLINARGPNFQINAACSSTSVAITLSEDLIRSGRVKRMIIIGADDPTSKTNLPYLGAGFLCTGAVTSEGDLYKAAIPFDQRRNGMIMGAGAVGLVLETREEVRKRGVIEVCELMGSHAFNNADHVAQINPDKFAHELNKFITRLEEECGLNRSELASDLIYISHETFTPPRGGCSQTEAIALQKIFGDGYRKIEISNTKGMTGHTMGASLEDVMAAKALQYQKVPPVVNCKVVDPELGDLRLSKGGSHNCSYALKMSAGFGSQGSYILLKKQAVGTERIVDQEKYRGWLWAISSDADPQLEYKGRMLALREKQLLVNTDQEQVAATIDRNSAALSLPVQRAVPAATIAAASNTAATDYRSIGAIKKPEMSNSKEELIRDILKVFAEVTKYPDEMLELNMEMEADLGIDTVKQATILSVLGEKYGLTQEEGFQLSRYPTIGHIVDLVIKSSGNTNAPMLSLVETRSKHVIAEAEISMKSQKDELKRNVLKVFAEVTKYPEEMLELNMEMEADLGIDTVKQATILSILGEKYGLQQEDGFQLSRYPTIGHIIDLIANRSLSITDSGTVREESLSAKAVSAQLPPNMVPQDQLKQEVLKVFAEVTKYPEEMLELNMEMEADLGIDTVKQATILSILGEKYGFQPEEGFQLSKYPTIGHIIGLFTAGSQVSETPNYKKEILSVESLIGDEEPTPILNEQPIIENDLSRQVMVLVEEKLGKKDFTLKDKRVWVMGHHEAAVNLIAATLEKKSTEIQSYVFPANPSEQQIKQSLAAWADNPAPDVIIDASHLMRECNFAEIATQEAEELLYLSGPARFVFYKTLLSKAKEAAKIICLTSLDGQLGYGAERNLQDPTYGALMGFYKSLRKEWPKVDMRIVDFDPEELSNKPTEFAKQLLDEIEHESLGFEIAYQQKKRYTLKIDDREVRATQQIEILPGETFLITGGARGITAHILETIAQRYPVNFIVVGSTALPENIEDLARFDQAALEQMKKDIHQQLKTAHSKVTPVMVEQEYQKIVKAIEVHHALEQVKKLGRKIMYITCDIRNYPKLQHCLAEARQMFGGIHAVIHAAGVEKSHLIEAKTVEEFNEVYTVKTQGAYNLMQLCKDDPLKLVVAFSSISGRFGNAAQLDYSSANNFLSCWVRTMAAKEKVHGVSLIWSGWKDIGMAWRNDFVRQNSEQMGLHFIEPAQGSVAFIQEMENKTNDHEVILRNGLGGFVEAGLQITKLDDFPLIDRIQKSQGQVKAFKVFSVKHDAIIDQHRLGENPILPAAGMTELLLEYFAMRTGKKAQYTLRDCQFLNAFKLYNEVPRQLYIEGQPLDDGKAWCVAVKSKFQHSKLKEAIETVHASAVISEGLGDYSSLSSKNWGYDSSNYITATLQEYRAALMPGSGMLAIHLGPLYNEIIRNPESDCDPIYIYQSHVICPHPFPQEQLTNDNYPLDRFVANPCSLDSVFQTAASYMVKTRNRVYLPYGAEEIGIVRPITQSGLYTGYGHLVEDKGDTLYFDITVVDQNQNTYYYAKRASFKIIQM